MPRTTPFSQRLGWLAAPLIAFAALFAVLALVNRSDEPTLPALAEDGEEQIDRTDTRATIVSLREAVSREPADAELRTALGDAYYQRSRETGNPRFYERADSAYAAALESDPASFAAISGQATIALAQHRFADGYELAREAHRRAPRVVAPYAALVDGLIETGRYRGAAGTLERMVGLKPNLASYSRISYYRELHGDLAGAGQALDLAISAGSGTIEGSAYIRSLRGDLEASRGHYARATLAYREALAIDPELGGALAGLAKLRAARGEYAPALSVLREQVGDPPSPDALVRLGEVEQAAGRMAAAERHYARALAIEERLLERGAGVDAGITLNVAEHGDPYKAARLGAEAWRTAPSVSSADAYSWALYRAGRIEAASRLSEEAMRLGSRNPEFLFHAGMIAAAAGREAEAGATLSALLERTPLFDTLDAPRAREALRELR